MMLNQKIKEIIYQLIFWEILFKIINKLIINKKKKKKFKSKQTQILKNKMNKMNNLLLIYL